MRDNWENGEKDFLVKLFNSMGQTDLRWRDDAIIVKLSDDLTLLYSIDNAEQIYNYENCSKNYICYGRWATALIASDIIACGIHPKGIALDIGIKNMSEKNFMHFVKGVNDICKYYNMEYEGGNINTTDSISGIAWGISNNEPIIKRDGCKDGDILVATCEIGVGWSSRLLQDAKISEAVILNSGYKDFPAINIEMFNEIWKEDVINCGMDLTDGIIEFGYEIYDRTGMGVQFDFTNEKSIFLKKASKLLNIPEVALRLEPGYDTPFSHGWSIAEENLNKVIKIFSKNNVKITILGRVNKEYSGVNLNYNGKLIELPRYWDDKINNRGSVSNWQNIILKLFKY